MELTEEKSKEQAEVLELLKFNIHMLDLEYLRELQKGFHSQATRQETLSILNPSYPQAGNDAVRLAGKALSHLCDYIETLKEIDEAKKEMKEYNQMRQNINNMFL